jgi:mono/diheme cytochrome c family protein
VKTIQWIGRLLLRVVIGLLALLVIAALGLWLNTQRIANQRFNNPVQDVHVAATPELVARGAYLVTAMPGCAGCHSSQPNASPPILDGNENADIKPLGDFYAPNLTPGGPLRDWSDGEIIRAIREGIAKDGRGLGLMPSDSFRSLSDADVQAIVAYLRSQPSVDKPSRPISLSPLGTALVGAGLLHLSVGEPVANVTAPPRGPTAAYGGYLAATTGCDGCHGPKLDGQNRRPGAPAGPNLRVVKNWTDEQFVRFMHTGVDPTGYKVSTVMPWAQYGKGSDDDLKALSQYLKSLP